ncbi:MAG: FAD-dependent oxidoreductase [Steroidobacteraceae bacterium]
MAAPRVIVVGAGPAGIRAAQALVRAGLRPLLVDEGELDGGRIYARRAAPLAIDPQELYGADAAAAQSVHTAFDALRAQVDLRTGVLAWNHVPGRLYVARDGRSETLEYDALIVCAGATDRLLPIAGWQHAGTYSLGGAQLALKTQSCAIGRRVAFVGTGPLLYLVASQYAKAGAGVAGVFDTSRWSLRLGALPRLLANWRLLLRGAGLERALRSGGVPLHRGITPRAIEGDAEGGVSGFTWRDADGRERRVDCDAVALGFHLRPEAQLADLARCAFEWHAPTHQWRPRIDADGRSTVRGVYLAGDGARLRGAAAAEASGELAALAALQDLGIATDGAAMASLRARLVQLQRFADGIAAAFPWPAPLAAGIADDTLVCRCESITAGELRRACREGGAREANRAKAFSRVGMGRCQGRYCGEAAAEIIAAAGGTTCDVVGRLRAQAPVKPLGAATEATP